MSQTAEATAFVETTLGQPLESSFGDALKSGAVLCDLLAVLRPDLAPKSIYRGPMAFKQRENVTAFIEGARNAGVEEHYNFVTVDLFEEKNLDSVARCLVALKRACGVGTAATNAPSSSPTASSSSSSRKGLPAEASLESFDQSTVAASQTGAGVSMAPSEVSHGAGGTALVSGRLENTQAIKCDICTKFITSGAVNACGRAWHPNCFNCKKCGVNLKTGKYYEFGSPSKPFCERCILIEKQTAGGGPRVKAATGDLAAKRGLNF